MPVEDYIPTIGLEVHCQVKTNTKMFCACETSFADEPNTHTCPTCMGLPGALPVLNGGAIEKTILAGMLIGCNTPPISKWDRKNYFYPDMPKNYQTTQLDLPLCLGGEVPLYDYAYPKDYQKNIANPGKNVQLNRIHLEEDVAKSTHIGKSSVIDFNRAGTPLMEIVSEPDIDTAEEAVAFLKSLQQILNYGDISDADMEKGQMRCDVNISVRPKGTDELGIRTELKNMNSISAIRRAIKYEIKRQCDELDRGVKQEQNTSRWDDDLGESQIMRTKEDAHDYRYFPCPDLLPIKTEEFVAIAKTKVPELPHEKSARFVADYGMTEYDSTVLSSDRLLADYFESAAKGSKVSGKKIANWIINSVLGLLNENDLEIQDCPVAPEKIAGVAQLVEDNICSNNQAKEVFEQLWSAPEKNPADIAKDLGFEPADEGELDAWVEEAISANPDKVEQIKGGNAKLVNFLTGQVMKLGKAAGQKPNPKAVTDLLKEKIGIE